MLETANNMKKTKGHKHENGPSFIHFCNNMFLIRNKNNLYKEEK